MPVKHYSTGMYVRLAFAVAAHLEPEILIVDEVLAVGDVTFQEKCLGKMKDIASGGRTVLFVSHNMTAIAQLTNRAVVLSHGILDFVGELQVAVAHYAQREKRTLRTEYDVRNSRRRYQGTGDVMIQSLRFDRTRASFGFLEPITFILSLRKVREVKQLRITMTVFTQGGSPVGSSFSPEICSIAAGEKFELVAALPSVTLAPGSYFCVVSVGRGDYRTTIVDYDIVSDTLFFDVEPEKTARGAVVHWDLDWGSMFFPSLAIESKQL